MSTSNNPFMYDTPQYKRDLNIKENYIRIAAQYLATETGDSVETISEWLKATITPEEPILHSLHRPDGLDRVKRKHTLSSYLNEVTQHNRPMAPNMVAYENQEKKKSYLAEFIEDGLHQRSIIKKRGQEAYMEKDLDTATYCGNSEVVIKMLNNTVSGAQVSPHNPIFNVSAHTSLTSICRCATSYSNAVVEKLLAGNRHYYSAEVCLADMANIPTIVDMGLIKEAIERYGLAIPTVDQLYHQIITSCQDYWRGTTPDENIYRYISKMPDLDRAAVAYVGDLHAIREYNDVFMRSFIGHLTTVATEGISDAADWVAKMDKDMMAMVNLITADLLDGRTVDKIRKESPDTYAVYGATVKRVITAFDDYSLLIHAFLRTQHMPTGIHSVPNMLRKVAIVSDTDSTIFTTEQWVKWFTGTRKTTGICMAVASVMAYIDSSVLAHTLAMLSKQMGVSDEQLYRLAMKSEFYMPAFGVVNATKHYYSYIKAREGNVYDKVVLDMKGVNLKNSRLPVDLRETLEKFICKCLDMAANDYKPRMLEVLEIPTIVAHRLRKSLEAGETTYLMSGQVKPIKAYKSSTAPPYQQYTFWNTVFGDTYGKSDPPPYQGVKVPVTLEKRIDLELWARTLPQPIQVKLREWLLRDVKYIYGTGNNASLCEQGVITLHDGDTILVASAVSPITGPRGRIYVYRGSSIDINLTSVETAYITHMEYLCSVRDGFTNFLVPNSRIINNLIPAHIQKVLDMDKIETELMNPFALVLETTGIYMRTNTRTRLLSQEVDIEHYIPKSTTVDIPLET